MYYYWIRYWVPGFIPDPVLGARSYVFYLISYPALGTWSQSIFIYTGSGTRYQLLFSSLFTGSVVSCQILCFMFFLDPILGTGLDAGSSTGYWTLCLIYLSFLAGTGYQILLGFFLLDLMSSTKILLFYIFYLDPVLGTRLNARSGIG